MVKTSSPRYLRPLLLTTGANLRILKALRNGVFKFTLFIRIHLGKEFRTSATIGCFADMFLSESPLRIIPMNRLCGLLMKWMIAQEAVWLFNAGGTLWWVLGSGIFSYQSACSLIYYFKCSTWNCNLRFWFLKCIE